MHGEPERSEATEIQGSHNAMNKICRALKYLIALRAIPRKRGSPCKHSSYSGFVEMTKSWGTFQVSPFQSSAARSYSR